jgi:UTP--glucose-1-phosphate uridylyltransferase
MNIRKAVITAGGRDQRNLPLQTLVDRDGVEKTALQIILEEVVAAGVDRVCLVIVPGDQGAYAKAAGATGGAGAGQLHFVEQHEARGYGHALSLAADFVGNEPFLHLVSDHLYLSQGSARCAQQVVERARAEGCAVSAVQPTREHMLPYYGTVGGRRVPRQTDLYEVENVLEKPTPSVAEQKLVVPGLRAGHYLCYFGIHVFTPAVLEMLAEVVSVGRIANPPYQSGGDGPVQLSPVLARLAGRERYLALDVKGTRFNIGVKYGLLTAQLALALDGADRENVLAQLVELLALSGRRTGNRPDLARDPRR